MGDEMTEGTGRVTNAVMRHELEEFKKEIRGDLGDLKKSVDSLGEKADKDREVLMAHLIQANGDSTEMHRRFTEIDQHRWEERIQRVEKFVTQAEMTATLVKFIAGTSALSAIYVGWQLVQLLATGSTQ